MQIRDRIKELRRVLASDLKPHPRNWRKHPDAQQDALRGVLAEIGYADALLVRELADGSLQLIDGHLRAETTPDQQVPVLVLDVDEEEANKILATHDPLSAMAAAEPTMLAELLADVETDSAAVRDMLEQLSQDAESSDSRSAPEVDIPESYQVVVECEDEEEQRHVYERIKSEGYRCRVLTL